ncbi:MAG: DUF1844 domain-containing protein [Thermodesulfobacteriota bacterium]
MAEEKDTKGDLHTGKSAEEVARDYDSAKRQDSGPQLPKMDFSMFIFSLNSSALVHLGLLEDPSTGQKSKNTAAAKQTIDILGMLEQKTRGNLTKEEEDMLKHILYDLRLMYVREVR